MKRLTIVALSALVVLVLGGCGSSGSSGSSGPCVFSPSGSKLCGAEAASYCHSAASKLSPECDRAMEAQDKAEGKTAGAKFWKCALEENGPCMAENEQAGESQ
jgi:hypothetical protein